MRTLKESSWAGAWLKGQVWLLAAVSMFGVWGGAALAATAQLSATYSLNIPAEKLADALQAFALASHHKLLYSSKLVQGLHCAGLKGEYTTEGAMRKLLAGTHLIYTITSEGLIVIRPPGGSSVITNVPANSSVSSTQSYQDGTDAPASPNQVQASGGGANFNSAASPAQTPTLEEVVVTAQKREQRLIDVPVPVTAISASTLIENNQVRLQDYYATIPGLNFTTDYNGSPILSIRGLTTGSGIGNPTTSVTIDGVPFGSSSSYGAFIALLPDIDPSDLARIEVLRGPQGTLYGSSSLGGLINYVTVEPTTDALSGRVEADLSAVQNAENPEYGLRAAANVPISETVALRISGFVRQTPGYIDNVFTHQNGTNRIKAQGAYLSLLIRPVDWGSLRLSALYQRNRGYGSSYADPALGDLKQENIPQTGIYQSDVQDYSAVFKADLGVARLTSLTGYNVNSAHDVQDDTNYFEALTQPLFGVPSSEDVDWQRTSKVSQEVRLSIPVTERIDWLLGVFYTHERSRAHQQYWAAYPDTGDILPNGNMLDGIWPTTYTEYAAFTNTTVKFTSRFDVQFGARESENRQTYSEVDGGGYTTVFGFPQAPAPLITPEVLTKDNSFTYLVTPRYRVASGLMLYARLATGYRPGGPNPTCSAYDLPCHFDPDRTQNYEIGMKGDLLDHRLDFDASVFYIDWKHIQLETIPPCECAESFVNAGGAKSQGIELSVQGRPAAGLTLSGWVDFTDAVLTSAFPADSYTVATSGERLPFSSRFSGNLAADENFPLASGATLFLGGEVSYVGNRIGLFEPESQRPYYPAYAETALHGGILVGDWRLTLFANNLTNRRGTLGGTPPVPYLGMGYTYIQPRTIGISGARNF